MRYSYDMNSNTAATTPKITDIYRWESPMSGRQVYVVTKVISDKWGTQYGLINLDTDEYVTSDLRQQGWTKVQ